MKSFFQILFWIYPGCDGVAEKDEILNDAGWINANHVTDTSKGRILFLIVSDVSQRDTPEQSESNHEKLANSKI